MNMLNLYLFDTFKYVDILTKEVNYFIILAEHQNVSKASEVLGIQQSGLSRALQRLESELGQKLFQRKNSGLVLTKAGQQFLKAAKNTKHSWEENFKQLINDSEEVPGLIKIGFHPSFGQKYFPQIARLISEKFPQLEIEVHTITSAQVTRKVNEQDLDFGLVISKVKNAELVQKKIGVDYLAIYQKDTHKVASKIILNPDMQGSLPIARKYILTKKILVKDYEIIAKTALQGNQMALLPHSVAKNYPLLKQISGTYLKADISVICHMSKMKTKAYKKIFDVILEACLG